VTLPTWEIAHCWASETALWSTLFVNAIAILTMCNALARNAREWLATRAGRPPKTLPPGEAIIWAAWTAFKQVLVIAVLILLVVIGVRANG